MLKKIKNISKQSLTIALGIVLGTTISIYASSLWHEPGGSNGFLQKVISENRVLKPNEIQKIKEDLEFLKNNGGGSLNHTNCHWEYPNDVTARGGLMFIVLLGIM